MKNKGFTLIELIAVIVILAVVAVITTFLIVNIIEDSKRGTLKTTASNLLHSAELYFSVNPEEELGGTFVITGGEFTKGDLAVNGELPENAEIIVDDKGNTSIKAIKNNYCMYKDFLETEVTVTSDLSFCYTTENCFNFDSSTGQITGYYAYEDNNSANAACPKYVLIPSKIDNVNVISIGNWAFTQKDLISVTISEGIQEIGVASFRTNNIKYVSLPNSIVTIGWGAFYENDIESIILPENITSIQLDAFHQNPLVNVIIYMHTVPGYMFDGGYNIKTLIIGDTVEVISVCSFSNNSLVSVTIPSSVTTIGDYAFGSNPLLTEVIIKGNDTNVTTRFDSRLSAIGFGSIPITHIEE